MEKFELKCESKYDDDLWEYRAIDRYVWYQIKKMIKDDSKLGKVLKVDEDGILRVNDKTRLLTAEQKKYAAKLIANQRDGIYRIHQLRDLTKKAPSKRKFDTWFDEKAMDSFMETIPTKTVFYSEPYKLLRDIQELHCNDEINRQCFSGYSIWQTMYALDMIDPFIVGMLLGGQIEIEEDINGYKNIIKFNYEGKCLYCKSDSIGLFEKNQKGELVKVSDTIHTLVFRHYQEPIYTTLNSMMYPIGGTRVLPCEGLGDPMNEDLVTDTKAILESDNYKALAKKYRLGYSRVNPRLY